MRNKTQISQAKTLLQRLEKVSPDSMCSHQASGIRSSLAKSLSDLTQEPGPKEMNKVKALMTIRFQILEKAAQEIPPNPAPKK
ncbi:MAG: hypothetical protein R6U51_05580 [Anaerolineales bacterium]